MKGYVFTNGGLVLPFLDSLKKKGIQVEMGNNEEDFRNLPEIKPDFLITEFPLWKLTRKDFFNTLTKIWENKILTIIISENLKVRKGDKKPWVYIIEFSPYFEERIRRKISEKLNLEQIKRKSPY